jgi:DNA-binding MarR family transcriptional regulator
MDPGTDRSDMERRLTELFCRVVERLPPSSEPGTPEGSPDLTPTQEACLGHIVTHPGLLLKDLARGLRISNPAATRLVDRLVARRYVRRELEPEDRRRVRLHPTPAGRRALDEARLAREQALLRVLTDMPPEGRRSLARGVEEFLRSALRSPGDIERVCRRCGTEHVTSCPLNTIHRELTGRPLTPV